MRITNNTELRIKPKKRPLQRGRFLLFAIRTESARIRNSHVCLLDRSK